MGTESAWFVYVLRCADGTLYTGITTDLDRRLGQHNAGTASKYTRARRPVAFAFTESQPDRSAASKREAAIKALRRDEKEALIQSRPATKRRTGVSTQRHKGPNQKATKDSQKG